MKPIRFVIVFALLINASGSGIVSAQPAAAEFAAPAVRFAAIDIFVESAEPLAAWQFELADASGSMTVVGIENGDSEAFSGTPYYDFDAVQADRADRIIVADYSLAARDALPSGRTRVATVHVRLMGTQTPDFVLELIAAGNVDGQAIRATANLEMEDGRAP